MKNLPPYNEPPMTAEEMNDLSNRIVDSEVGTIGNLVLVVGSTLGVMSVIALLAGPFLPCK